MKKEEDRGSLVAAIQLVIVGAGFLCHDSFRLFRGVVVDWNREVPFVTAFCFFGFAAFLVVGRQYLRRIPADAVPPDRPRSRVEAPDGLSD